MNCNDIVMNVLGKLDGKDALIASHVCGEWKQTLKKQTEKYLIKEYLEKLEKLVEEYSDCEVNIVLENMSKVELLQQKNDAEKKVNDFFEQRNKNYDKKLYIKAIKRCIYPKMFDYKYGIKYGYNRSEPFGFIYAEYFGFIYAEFFVKKCNELQKHL